MTSYEDLVRGALTAPRRTAVVEPDVSAELTALLYRSAARGSESDTSRT